MHARTQYDGDRGLCVSEQRFFSKTRWPRDLKGELIRVVGSGSGRFIDEAAYTYVMVVLLDYSYAVEANDATNGARPNVLIVSG